MSVMIVKTDKVMPRASGIYEGCGRAGPFIVKRDLDLEAFVEQTSAAFEDSWEVSVLMYEIPQNASSPRLTSPLPCQKSS